MTTALQSPYEVFATPLPRKPYYLRQPLIEKSSIFHNHVDAESHTLLRKMIAEIEAQSSDFQNKIYPIDYLVLGPQTSGEDFAAVYQKLPNFHPIHNAANEAFATGKMGPGGIHYAQTRATLEVAFSYPQSGVMTEIEEDIFELSFDAEGRETISLDQGPTPYTVNWDELPGWRQRMIAQVPRFELHHGFDFVKGAVTDAPPLAPEELSRLTAEAGFQTGGWFIFAKETSWAYRSNEFSNASYAVCMSVLKQQALALRRLLAQHLPGRPIKSSCSLEKVHAIWKV